MLFAPMIAVVETGLLGFPRALNGPNVLYIDPFYFKRLQLLCIQHGQYTHLISQSHGCAVKYVAVESHPKANASLRSEK
jgi:hypothetical protein